MSGFLGDNSQDCLGAGMGICAAAAGPLPRALAVVLNGQLPARRNRADGGRLLPTEQQTGKKSSRRLRSQRPPGRIPRQLGSRGGRTVPRASGGSSLSLQNNLELAEVGVRDRRAMVDPEPARANLHLRRSRPRGT